MPGNPLRILIVGDIVGRPGRRAVKELLPQLKESLSVDCVIANAENAAAGSGIPPRLFREVRASEFDWPGRSAVD